MIASENQRVDPRQLAYPVLAFDRLSFGIKKDLDDLTVVWTSLIKSGWFEELLLVDSEARTFVVEAATKLGGVGFLWGLNPLYGQRVRVSLDLQRRPQDLKLDELKSRLLSMMTSWSGWRSRDDFDELVACIRQAESIGELIDGLKTFV